MKPDIEKLRKMVRTLDQNPWIASPKSGVLGIGIVASETGHVIAMGLPNQHVAEIIVEMHNKIKEVIDYIDELESKKNGQE
jgi:hypothetical protein